jgi:predicted nucleic-acid-binding protein
MCPKELPAVRLNCSGNRDRDRTAPAGEVLAIENEQEVFTAIVALKQGHGSFSDALIAELGTRVGCTRTLTFDRKATRLPGFELV